MNQEILRKRRLAQVRANDAAHEAMMQEAAKAAGVNLRAIRAMGNKPTFGPRDRAFRAMFQKARK